MFGPEIALPLGSYSDDTQLRLATSRSIRGDGFFDVESFAKIELPVWLNYALGAGRGSKAAASNLSLRESTWSQNFYSSPSGTYWDGGGNGAAMRIQPHVWQSHSLGASGFIRDVVRNSICTHGHPRAIIGAAIHAMFLHHTLSEHRAVQPSEWSNLGEAAAIYAYEILVEDAELSLVWVPNWENKSKNSLKAVWAQTVLEWHQAVDLAVNHLSRSDNSATVYQELVFELGCFRAEERGSGLKTPLLASALAWLFKDDRPEVPLLVSANTFGSDTDTIATMAGALIGSIADSAPNVEIQDAAYIVEEARRLFLIGEGKKQKSFRYPDLLTWSPPRTQSDAWVVRDGENTILGLGKASLLGEPYASTRGAEMVWHWCLLPFGQTILAKRRKSIAADDNSIQPVSEKRTVGPRNELHTQNQQPQPNLAEMTINERTQICIKSGFNPALIGEHLISLANGDNGIEQVVGFAAIIAKAKLARDAK
jgi:ADP-ribosylglycohydrolase